MSDSEFNKLVEGGLTRTDCRILNRFLMQKKTKMKSYELVGPLALNKTHMNHLLEVGAVKETRGFQSVGRQPFYFTLTELGEAIIDYMKKNDIEVMDG